MRPLTEAEEMCEKVAQRFNSAMPLETPGVLTIKEALDAIDELEAEFFNTYPNLMVDLALVRLMPPQWLAYRLTVSNNSAEKRGAERRTVEEVLDLSTVGIAIKSIWMEP